MGRRIPPWSDLPPELLSTIASTLNSNPLDIFRFRSVCKSWRLSTTLSSTTLSPPFPLTTPSPPYPLVNHHFLRRHTTSVLSVTIIYALRPPIEEIIPSWMPRVWVLFLDQSNPLKVSFRKPFSWSAYSIPINFPRSINLLDFHASELGRFYNLSDLIIGDKPFVWSGLVYKVVVLSDCDTGLMVVVLSDDGKLGLLRLGLGYDYHNVGTETEWKVIHDGKGFRFDDIIDFKGRVLGIDRRGRVYEIRIGTVNVIVPPIAGGGGRRKRLVESLGCLYLVVHCNVRRQIDAALFKVYELNEGTKKWVEVSSIGDRTFFFGLEFSFSASAENLPGPCGRNCILFKQQSFLKYNGIDDDCKLFRDLQHKELDVGVWHLEDAANIGVIRSHPGYSNVLWPPPSWIWPKDKSERVGILLANLDQLLLKIPDEKLKAKFNELSAAQQEGALALMKEALMMKELLDEIKEMDKTMKFIEMMFVSLQQHSTSGNLHNQVETSTLWTEEMRAPLELLRIAIKHFDWFSMESKINGLILKFEESTGTLEVALEMHKFPEVVNIT